MPITKSAKKAVSNASRKRTRNQAQRKAYKEAVKGARAEVTPASLSAAQKALDKAAKNGVIHKNKASRLKSRLAKAATAK
ncbi:MAG: 30S ribosomal protein S20 [Patescibacteria group bacterium]